MFKRLSFAGIKINTLSEGEISKLHIGLKCTMNALFLKDLADKTRRGLRGRVEKGRSCRGKCCGYDVVAGEERGQHVVNEADAAVVDASLKTTHPRNPLRPSLSNSTKRVFQGLAAKDGDRAPSTAKGSAAQGY